MDEISIRNTGLDYFRRAVALVYREIGVLRPTHHSAIAAKTTSSREFFGPDRKSRAKGLYKLSITDPDISFTLARYEKHTGLTLDDVREAFANGRWGNPPSYGGPKWAAITSAAVDLAEAIRRKAWPEVPAIVSRINGLNHNNGRIVGKFKQLD